MLNSYLDLLSDDPNRNQQIQRTLSVWIRENRELHHADQRLHTKLGFGAKVYLTTLLSNYNECS